MKIPLLAVGTLKAIAAGFYMANERNDRCCPMIDARRMEVYTAIYDHALNELCEVEAVIIESSSFSNELAKGPIHFVGDGAEKCASTLTHENAHFEGNVAASARWMGPIAQECLDRKEFEDLAYFVPFYLKAYQAGPKKA